MHKFFESSFPSDLLLHKSALSPRDPGQISATKMDDEFEVYAEDNFDKELKKLGTSLRPLVSVLFCFYTDAFRQIGKHLMTKKVKKRSMFYWTMACPRRSSPLLKIVIFPLTWRMVGRLCS